MRRSPLIVVALALGVLAVAPGVGATPATPRATGLEAAIAQEVNAVRAARGLPTLRGSAGLSRAAGAHTGAMLDVGAFAHEFPGWLSFSQRLKRYYAPGKTAWSGAENLALFGPDAPTAQDVVSAWMGSPGHRANILGRSWRELGVAVRFAPAAGGDFGGAPTWVVTLDLGRRGA